MRAVIGRTVTRAWEPPVRRLAAYTPPPTASEAVQRARQAWRAFDEACQQPWLQTFWVKWTIVGAVVYGVGTKVL